MALQIRKAERKRVAMKLAMNGPAGSGKTFSALRLASGLGSKIILIDSENGSGELYGDRFTYDVIQLDAPFTTEKYSEAIKLAEKHGYDVLIIDSLTHAWDGDGGLLQQKEALDKSNRNSNAFTNWASITRKHEDFKQQVLQSPLHIIATMRTKTEYVLETNQYGKQVPKKVGMRAIQRDGLEYEFTVVFELDHEHNATVSKDRTSLFDGRVFQVNEDCGEQIKAWLDGGNAPAPAPIAAPRPAATQADKPADSQPDPAIAAAYRAYRAAYAQAKNSEISTPEEKAAFRKDTADFLGIRTDFKFEALTVAQYEAATQRVTAKAAD